MKIADKKSFPLLLIFMLWSLCAGFGKNKVQYTDLTWQARKTPHFTVYTHQNEETISSIAPYWIEKAYTSLHLQFQFTHKVRIPLIIYGNTTLFTQTNIITELLPEEVGGFTELFKNRIAIPFNGSYKDFRHVLHHELVHAFVFGMMFEQLGSNLLSGNLQLPLWFMEGAAEYLSSRWDTEADMFMIDLTLNSALPNPAGGLDGYLAYKGGQSFLYFLATSRGDSLFNKFLVEVKASKRIDNSIKKVYRKPLDEIGKEWIRELRRLYWPEIGCRIEPSTNATPITRHLEDRDHFNLRARISPNGEQIAFFSDLKDYTRIMITDRKGKILHEISQNGYGGFFESFHPFRSGICWSPDSKRLAFITSSGGKDELRIVNLAKKRLERRIHTRCASISSPDWSRDGSSIVFTGVASGSNDLYRYTLASDSLTRLTNSVACEADPRFSPDGRHIVFSIEDTSGLLPDAHSAYGPQPSDLAILDCTTDSITRLTSTIWTEKEPCFSSDGKRLLFVDNRNGIDNCYIATIDSIEDAHPITNYTGGCSNPDWASGCDRMVFTLFNNQGWDVWMMDTPLKNLITEPLAPTRWVASFSDTTQHFFKKVTLPSDTADSTLTTGKKKTAPTPRLKKEDSGIHESPPATQANSTEHKKDNPIADIVPDSTTVDSSVTGHSSPNGTMTADSPTVADSAAVALDSVKPSSHDTLTGAGKGTDDSSSAPTTVSGAQPYRLIFSPDMVSVGLGMSTTYSPAGQVVIALSDLLGDHRITFAGDIQGNFKDYAHLFLSYLYLKQRINAGAGAFYSKDYTYASMFGFRLYHNLEYGGFAIAQYPFSMFSRLDMQLFARHIEQTPYAAEGPSLKANMCLSSLSYVFDNILWGITGPLNGIRATATVQVSPPLDIVSEPFVAVDADVRHYWHLFKRFVWANRIFVGASAPLGQDYSARRYLLGGNDNWWIFQVNPEEYEKNSAFTFYSDFVTPFRGWNYVDLSGTRAAVINSEFRFPFVREISLVWPLPMQIRYINGALFTDIGNVWEAGMHNGRLPLPEKIYGGFGFGLRADIGIFILRFDRGWPTDWNSFVGAPINYYSLGAEF